MHRIKKRCEHAHLRTFFTNKFHTPQCTEFPLTKLNLASLIDNCSLKSIINRSLSEEYWVKVFLVSLRKRMHRLRVVKGRYNYRERAVLRMRGGEPGDFSFVDR